MELIDKEKTTRAVTYWSRHYDPSKPRFDKRNVEDVINDQPIVEAIPIEWLKKKYEEADDMGMGIEAWSIKDCYGEVLAQWEKENEID